MNYINCTPSSQSNSTALLDSGCTVHFLIANSHCKNKVLTQTPLEVRLPNGAKIASTHTATLDIPSFPKAARQAHILPALAQHSLISMGQMCDSGCPLTFTANKVAVTHGAATILTGQRDKDSGLWRVPLENTTVIQDKLRLNMLYTMYMHKILSRTPLRTYMHVVSALCKTLDSSLFKMSTSKHGHH
jgi:hypothetical protein